MPSRYLKTLPPNLWNAIQRAWPHWHDICGLCCLSEQSAREKKHPNWRWPHGNVENVAAAIGLAATHSKASNTTFHVGENPTPRVEQRRTHLRSSFLRSAGGRHRFVRLSPRYRLFRAIHTRVGLVL